MAKRPRDQVEREIMDIIPERFDGGSLDSMNARRGGNTRLILSIALGLLMIAAVGVAARHLLVGEGQKVSAEDNIPVIKPDDKPIKTKPEDRGGMEVPNQDKLVYQDLGKGNAANDAEKLMPSAEKPQAPPAQMPPAKAPAAAANDAAGGTMPAPPAAVASNVPAPPAMAPATNNTSASQAAPANAPTPLTPPDMKKTEAAQAKPPAAPAPTKAAAAPAPAPAKASASPATGGAYQIQLAALKSEADAQAAWKKAVAANKDLLGGLTVDVQRADLGAKGVFFRLRAGPLDEAAAKSLCAELVSRSQGCIVARK